MADHPRIIELRRRVQADPASMAFAQLAEECRRAGANDEAVGICRAGLAHHPDYLSARVTLGRALVELGRLDEALTELTIVLATAPDNLPAIRSIAEVHQRRGQMAEALTHYRRALQLARHDPDLEHAVERIQKEVAPAPVQSTAAPVAIHELFDFDALLSQLGPEVPAAPPIPETPIVAAPSQIDAIELPADDADTFAVLERQLRENEEQRTREAEEQRVREAEEQRVREADEQRIREAEERQMRGAEEQRIRDEQRRIAEEELAIAQAALAREVEAERRRLLALQELEEWLSAIAVDRQQRSA